MAWRFQGRINSGPYTGLWRVGLSIETLGKQVDALWPGRGKASDGTLGNTAHQNRRSDHNPNISDGPFDVVTAIDITDHDASGADMALVAEAIRIAQDPRVKYLIHNRKIFAHYHRTTRPAWEWGPYSGTNAHLSHMHLSVRKEKNLYDDNKPWPINGEGEPDDMTELQARMEIATGWGEVSGVWMSATASEDPQERLTRLAAEVLAGRTVDDIVQHAPPGTNELGDVPAWVLVASQPFTDNVPGDLGDVDSLVDTAIAEHADNPDAHHA